MLYIYLSEQMRKSKRGRANELCALTYTSSTRRAHDRNSLGPLIIWSKAPALSFVGLCDSVLVRVCGSTADGLFIRLPAADASALCLYIYFASTILYIYARGYIAYKKPCALLSVSNNYSANTLMRLFDHLTSLS